MAGRRKSLLKTQILPSEYEEQKGLVKWLRLKSILFYHIPNGGLRNVREAVKFKAMGVSAGVPDICIPIPTSMGAALYIEMKTKKGGVTSIHQKEWIEALREKGNCVEVAHGAEEAINIITKYLSAY